MDYPFEEYLKNIHASNYMGTDDDMPDNYERWLSNLDIEEIIRYGNQALNMALDINMVYIDIESKP